MNHFFKRTGWLLLAVAALAASMALQIIMGVVALLPATFLVGIEAGLRGIADPVQIQEMITQKAAGAAAYGVLFYHILSLPVFGLWYYFGCGRPKAVNPLKVLKPLCVLSTAVAGLGLCLVANGIAMMIQYLAPEVFENYLKLMETAGMGVSPVTIIAAVLLAPIGEEILCRGIILYYGRRMAEGMGGKEVSFWIANVLQALLFGVMHANLVQGTYAFVLGMGLGVLYRRYNSLYPAMLCHFAINFLSTYVMEHLFGWVPESGMGICLIFMMGTALTLLAVILGKEKRNISS